MHIYHIFDFWTKYYHICVVELNFGKD